MKPEAVTVNFRLKLPPLLEVMLERNRQRDKWGNQNHVTPHQWLAIIAEELGEVAKEVAEVRVNETGLSSNYRTELVQLAACAVAALEAYDAGTITPCRSSST